MINPSAVAVLACIEGNLASKVEPHVTDPLALSTLATVKHLLRHTARRFAAEGQVLTDDIAALRALLPRIAARYPGQPAAAAIEATLARTFRAPDSYPDLVSLADEAAALRGALETGQRALQAEDEAQRAHPDYATLRAAIRDYLTARIAAETALVEPAFRGQGPRR